MVHKYYLILGPMALLFSRRYAIVFMELNPVTLHRSVGNSSMNADDPYQVEGESAKHAQARPGSLAMPGESALPMVDGIGKAGEEPECAREEDNDQK